MPVVCEDRGKACEKLYGWQLQGGPRYLYSEGQAFKQTVILVLFA